MDGPRRILKAFRVDDIECWQLEAAAQHRNVPAGKFMRDSVMQEVVKVLREAVKEAPEHHA